jgi:uncharacterized OB-fold protein
MASFPRPLPALEPLTAAFWRACHAGRLEFSRCTACNYFIHPARPLCPKCRGRDLVPTPVSGRARLHSFTVNHQRWFPGQEVPYVIGLVELVEQKGLRLTTNIINCPPEQVAIGMPLRVVFEPVSEEVALPLFEPEQPA